MIEKNIKYDDPVVQGGVDNYLGKQPQVQAPRKWQSSPDKPATELAYITEAEKDLILKANIHGGLEGGPNMGPSGIMSLDSFGDVGGAGASGGDTDAGGGASQGAGTGGGGFSGRSVAEMKDPRDKAFQDRINYEKGKLQNAERFQARDLGYKERANIANATYGPLQKYTDRSRFFGGANKYGYTDTLPDGSLKPGFGGRFFGGLMSLLTGVPLVGSAIGNMYDKGKGLFRNKYYDDMSEFNKLGLDGIKPDTYDFDPNPQINPDVDTTGYSRFSDESLGTPNLNNLESLINASQINEFGQSPEFSASLINEFGDNRNINMDNQGITGIDVGYPSNDLMADASAPGNNFLYNTGNPYKDNLYNKDGEYDPYSIKGEPEVKEIETG